MEDIQQSHRQRIKCVVRTKANFTEVNDLKQSKNKEWHNSNSSNTKFATPGDLIGGCRRYGSHDRDSVTRATDEDLNVYTPDRRTQNSN